MGHAWERVREYEEQQRKSGVETKYGGSGERASGRRVHASFMACEVLRRYYVGVHGLDFEIKAGAVAADDSSGQ